MRTSKHGTPGERREKVLRAGAACFARKGFYDATFDDIIGESGLSRGSLYWHFDSKDQLYDAVVEHSIAEVDGWLVAGPDALAGEGPLIDRLFQALGDDLSRHEDHYRLLYLAPRPRRAQEPVQFLTRRFLDYIREVVDESVARHELDERLAGVLPDVVYALLEGMILRRLYDATFDVAQFVAHAAHLVRNATPPATADTETTFNTNIKERS